MLGFFQASVIPHWSSEMSLVFVFLSSFCPCFAGEWTEDVIKLLFDTAVCFRCCVGSVSLCSLIMYCCGLYTKYYILVRPLHIHYHSNGITAALSGRHLHRMACITAVAPSSRHLSPACVQQLQHYVGVTDPTA